MTKKDRHRIYKNILKKVKIDGWGRLGFCLYLKKENPEVDPYGKFGEGDGEGIKTHYPELWKKKPKRKTDSCYWFPTYLFEDIKRERILEFAIKETAPKPRKNVTYRRKTSTKR